jgi:TonB family protein
MRNRRILFRVTAVLVCIGYAMPSSAQDDSPRLTPGTVALMAVEQVTAPNEALLIDALSSARPAVRAAAARVAFAQGRTGMLPHIVRALQAETNGDAAEEQARFVAVFGTTESDPVLLEASVRVTPPAGGSIATIIANARGTAALRYLPRLRPVLGNVRVLVTFVRLAVNGEITILEEVLESAGRSADAALVAAALESARQDAIQLREDTVLLLLVPESSAEVRAVATAHVLLSSPSADGLSDRMRTALEAARPPQLPDDPAMQLLAELSRRLTGGDGRADAAWNSVLTTRARELQTRLIDWSIPTVTNRLSASEYATFTAALYGKPRAVADAGPTPATGRPVTPDSIRLLSGYPREFVASVFTSARCDLGRLKTGNSGSGGIVTYRSDGRVGRVSLIDPPASAECARAVRALLFTYVPTPDRRLRSDQQETLMFPFEPRFVACQDAITEAPPQTLTSPGRVTPPKQTRRVNPAYPASAQTDLVSGTVVIEAVISTTGCVAAAAVMTSVDPRLDWAALRAISGWGYTAALLEGVPVPVVMTVTVEFSLK